MSGNDTDSAFGVYGIQGIASENNNPGSRYASTSWQTLDGKVWIFGGFGFAFEDVGSE